MGEIAIKPIHNVHKNYKKVNLVNPYIFAPPAPVYNTYIGGVAGTISTASALAAKLGISVGAISNFAIVGGDIKCKITGSYAMPDNAFLNNTEITYFSDNSIVNEIKSSCFYNCPKLSWISMSGVLSITGVNSFRDTPKLQEIYFPNCTAIANNAFYNGDNIKLKTYAFPKLTNLGSTVGNNNVFYDYTQNAKLICPVSLQTVNSGSPDGDIQALLTGSGAVVYSTNLTSPDYVTTLAAGTIYNTAIQLNFTAPSSANSIDHYECWVNGIKKNNITSSGQYVIGLTSYTNYSISIVAVDVFYNKSTVSNILNVSTLNNTWDISTGLISYYKLDSNSKDYYNSNNGTDTSVSYITGKISNAGSYNGTTSKTVIGNPIDLQISSGTISCWIKTTNPGASYRHIFGKPNAYSMFLVDGIFGIYSWAGASGFKTTGVDLRDGNWHHIAFVFESGTSLNYLYVDGVLKLTTSMTISNQATNFEIGESTPNNQKINALIDEGSVYNAKLTLAQIQLIYNSGNGITL